MRKISASNKPAAAKRATTSRRRVASATSRKRSAPKKTPGVKITAENRLLHDEPSRHVPCRDSKADKAVLTITPWTRNHLKNNFVGVWKELLTQERIVDVTGEMWPDDVRLSRKPPPPFPSEYDVTPQSSSLFSSSHPYSRVVRAYRNARADGVPVFEEEEPLLTDGPPRLEHRGPVSDPQPVRTSLVVCDPPPIDSLPSDFLASAGGLSLEERTNAILALPDPLSPAPILCPQMKSQRRLLHPELIPPNQQLFNEQVRPASLPKRPHDPLPSPDELFSSARCFPFDDGEARCTKRSRPQALHSDPVKKVLSSSLVFPSYSPHAVPLESAEQGDQQQQHLQFVSSSGVHPPAAFKGPLIDSSIQPTSSSPDVVRSEVLRPACLKRMNRRQDRRAASLHRPVLDLRRDISSLKNCAVCDGSEKWFDAEFTWDETIDEINETVFGNESFRELQREIINAVLSREDVFAMLPTGGGKSLCYQVAGLVDSGVTMVIMPLVSLMQDQYETMFALDVGVKNLSGNLTWDETRRIYDMLENPSHYNNPRKTSHEDDDQQIDTGGRGSLKFVFVTPEKIGASESLMDLLSRLYSAGRLSRFVVDEAHCVSQWGNDFRPDYTKLKVLRDKFPDVPILALTASATIDILEDVVTQLGMRNAQVFRRSFNRPNLIYSVHLRSTAATRTSSRSTSSAQITDAFLDAEIVPLIKNQFRDQCGIIYCFSRNNCDEVAARLRQHGIASEMYHAGMPATDRERVQRGWMAEEFHIIVATIAFGMGINKKDCRFVIHLAMPKSIENYYQESGRAGRDGHPAHCVLYYDPKDKQKHTWLMKQTTMNFGGGCRQGPPVSGSRHDQTERGLLEMLNFCQDNISCRRKMMLDHFGESFEGKACDLPCDSCSSDMKSKYVEMPCVDEVGKVMEILSVLQTASFESCPRLTLLDVKSLLMGVKFKKQNSILDKLAKLQAIGYLKKRGYSSDDVVRFLSKMITCKILSERVVSLPHNGTVAYLNLGPNAWDAPRLMPHFCIAKKPPPSAGGLAPYKNSSDACLSSHDDTTTTEGASTVESMEESSNSTVVAPSGPPCNEEISSTGRSWTSQITEGQTDLLYAELVALRKKLTSQFGLHNAGSIINLEGLRQLATHTPTDLAALRELEIPNFTSKTKIEKYGFVFTHHIMLFLERSSLTANLSDRPAHHHPRLSRAESFRSAQSDNVEWIDLDEIE